MFDRDHDNLSLDTLEQLHIDKPDDGEPALVPCHLEIVSLWYRRDPATGDRRRAHVCVLSPAGVPLAHFPLDIDLRTTQRYRTRCVIEGLLVERPGTYYFAIDLLDGEPAREVARIPLEVAFAAPAQAAAARG